MTSICGWLKDIDPSVIVRNKEEANRRDLRNKGRTLSSPPFLVLRDAHFAGSVVLLCGHLFLLAFHAHCLELALFGVVRFLNLGLNLGCRFFELG